MVGYDSKGRELSNTEYAFAGATSGFVTRLLSQPFDVIKIRFQLQVEPVRRSHLSSKYNGILQATSTIVKEEGLLALWKGHNPAQFLSVIYGIVQFVSFEFLTKQANLIFSTGRTSYLHFICGASAGTLATVVSFPFDVIRTRFVIQGNTKIYRNMAHCVRNMVMLEGPSALFKGLSPTLIQVAPHSGATFAFYNVISRLTKDISLFSTDGKELKLSGNLVAGSLTGLFAKTSVYPFDLARKRLQLQGFQSARQGFGKNFTCVGLINCLWLTAVNEGFLALFKGLTPSMLKAAVTTSLYFTVYEETCKRMPAIKQ